MSLLGVAWWQVGRIDVYKTPGILKAGEGPRVPGRIRL